MKKIGLMLIMIAALVMSSLALVGHAQKGAKQTPGERNSFRSQQNSAGSADGEAQKLEISADAGSGFTAGAADEQLAAACVPRIITHSLRQTIIPGNTVACGANPPNNFTRANSYWRAFNLGTQFGFTDPFTISQVQVAVQVANSTTASQTLTVRLYTNSGGAFPAGTRTQVLSNAFTLPNIAGPTLLTLTLSAPVTVPAASELVYEVATQDHTTNNNFIIIGSNNLGQTGPTYISAAACGLANPADVASIGFAGTHIIMNVLGCTARVRPSDFDLDSRSDISVVRPNGDGTGQLVWHILNSSGGVGTQVFGSDTDTIVPGDYDGNLSTEIAVFRPDDNGAGLGQQSAWYISKGSAQNFDRIEWGLNGDIPVPGDYDGDKKTDVAVFRPSDTTWYIRLSSTGALRAQQWGQATDKPVVGDYDGDGKADVAVWRPTDGTWYILRSFTNSLAGPVWGQAGDRPVQGDYDQDGKTDLAVFRAANATWYIQRSFDAVVYAPQWGATTDTPVPADYDLDGRHDVAVFRPTTGDWFILNSSTGSTLGVNWGQAGDRPTPTAYLPTP
jgi:hypothetical protein